MKKSWTASLEPAVRPFEGATIALGSVSCWDYARRYGWGYRIPKQYPRYCDNLTSKINDLERRPTTVINPDFALRAAAAWTALRAQCRSLFLFKFEIHLLPRPLSDFVRSGCLERRGAGTISSYKEEP
jgi:hypothetical protein